MANHAKPKAPFPRGLRITLIALLAVAAVAAVAWILSGGGVLDAIGRRFNEPTESQETETTVTEPTEPAALPEPVYAVPDTVKGVWLVPGTDFLLKNSDSESAVRAQIDAAFSAMAPWEFNTVIVPLDHVADNERRVFFASAHAKQWIIGENFDPIAYILQKARAADMTVFGVMDLRIRTVCDGDPRTADGRAKLAALAAEYQKTYAVDGLFLRDFTFSGSAVATEADREAAAAGLNELVKTVTDGWRQVNRNTLVGLVSSGVWSHASNAEGGSDTANCFEEKTDGCADTRAWLEQGLFSGVMVEPSQSTTHATAPFSKILAWWDGEAARLHLPLYVTHAADAVGTAATGWKSVDQLAQQYLYCKAASSWRGSAYRSLSALKNDQTGAAEALRRAYSGTLDEEFIYKNLTVSKPAKTTYTTTESTVSFQGGGDTNFPLTVNGAAVELSEHGFFTQNYTLKLGVNTFTFAHKGQTKTYKITYKQTLLTAVSPSAAMTVDGDSSFVIRAVARKGSAVTAKLGSTTVKLTAVTDKSEETETEESDFSSYSGALTLPAGKIGKTISLGNITVTAVYSGLTETKTGGVITVAALPQPPKPTATTTSATTATGGTASDEAPAVLTKPAAGNGTVVEITAQYAETFTGSTTDDYSRPYNSYLPRGTWDALAGKVYNGAYSYYKLASGKRVYMSDAKLHASSVVSDTRLTGGTSSQSGAYTVFTFHAAWNVPVYYAAYPQKYYRDTTTAEPNYSLENYSQTATYVEVTFHHLSSVPAAPSVADSPLFSSAEWKKTADSVYTLHLTLRDKGKFYGCRPVWKNGTLTLSFLNPAGVSSNPAESKLKGVRILLDPGHGSPTDKPWEAPYNLAYANTLKAKLEALGATVTMTRTAQLTGELPLQTRVEKEHAGTYHLLISVHMNGANGTATGATVHYYNEPGYTVASYIYPKMHAVETPYGVGTTQNGRPRSSGTVWGTLYMTRSVFDCPSVLLECAFLDNTKDKEALSNAAYRDKLMQAVTDGVVAYFSAQ